MKKNLEIDWNRMCSYDVVNDFFVKYRPDDEEEELKFNEDLTLLVVYLEHNRYTQYTSFVEKFVKDNKEVKRLINDIEAYKTFLSMVRGVI